MARYIVRRILLAIPTLLTVLTLVFLLLRVAPGDPAVVILGQYASEETLQAFRERMGLNRPLWIQYLSFLSDLLRGNLGESLISGVPVAEQVRAALPYTLELTASGIFLGALFGVPLGVLTAVRRNSFVDYLGRTFSLAGLSVPAFFLGILLMYLLSIKLNLFPTLGAGSPGNLMDRLFHLTLPGLALGLVMTAYVTRMTRSAMLNVLREDYIRTARAKGLREQVVLYRHALRSALIPIISIIGIYSIVLLGSSVMVEIVFSRPGLGKIMLTAMKQRDYAVLQSVMVIYAAFAVLLNLLTDLLYGLVDPRIRYD
ncbi:MAG: ABC transporter permease [Armatimonadota bacterium]|nr:ABC transporter permease [Armatimonadota bacterium]MDR5702984.1 ABC transporter permease [Armatimonadota bacterium]MDR7433718.1 ABC transporter permease [Armatimonadota bacterium]